MLYIIQYNRGKFKRMMCTEKDFLHGKTILSLFFQIYLVIEDFEFENTGARISIELLLILIIFLFI